LLVDTDASFLFSQELKLELSSKLYKNADEEFHKLAAYIDSVKHSGEDLNLVYSLLDKYARRFPLANLYMMDEALFCSA
jgi:hypothetical protein